MESYPLDVGGLVPHLAQQAEAVSAWSASRSVPHHDHAGLGHPGGDRGCRRDRAASLLAVAGEVAPAAPRPRGSRRFDFDLDDLQPGRPERRRLTGRQDPRTRPGLPANQDEHDPEKWLPGCPFGPAEIRNLGAGSRPEGVGWLTQSALQLIGSHNRQATPPLALSSAIQWNPGEQSCVCAGMKTRALLARVVSAALTGAVAGFLLLGPGGGAPSQPQNTIEQALTRFVADRFEVGYVGR